MVPGRRRDSRAVKSSGTMGEFIGPRAQNNPVESQGEHRNCGACRQEGPARKDAFIDWLAEYLNQVVHGIEVIEPDKVFLRDGFGRVDHGCRLQPSGQAHLVHFRDIREVYGPSAKSARPTPRAKAALH